MIEYRSMWKQVLFFILTLGLYGIYWFFITSDEMVAHNKQVDSPPLWTILLFVPFLNFYSYWKYSQAVDELSDGSYPTWLIFVLWILFSPAVWALSQRQLNKLATQDV